MVKKDCAGLRELASMASGSQDMLSRSVGPTFLTIPMIVVPIIFHFSDDEQKVPKTTKKLRRKCRKTAKAKKVKRQLNIDIENVRMGRVSSGESDGGEQDDEDHMMLEPPPGKFGSFCASIYLSKGFEKAFPLFALRYESSFNGTSPMAEDGEVVKLDPSEHMALVHGNL